MTKPKGRTSCRLSSMGLSSLVALILFIAVPTSAFAEAEPDVATTPALAGLQVCIDDAPPARNVRAFEHTRSQLVRKLGDARHSARDTVVVPGEPARLAAKFGYGPLLKDLEDEQIEVWVDDCQGWRKVATTRTDDDGAIDASWTPKLGVGIYDMAFRVVGDNTYTRSRLWLLPRGTRLAVFDIDGTLTTSDGEGMREVVSDYWGGEDAGTYQPKSFASARELTRAYARRGWLPVYLSGRPYWLTEHTRRWLQDEGYAPGAVIVTERSSQFLPSSNGVGMWKLGQLNALRDRGLKLDYAHGNAATDVFAYTRFGFDVAKTFIVGPNAGAEGTQAIADAWEELTAKVDELPPCEQPFAPAATLVATKVVPTEGASE